MCERTFAGGAEEIGSVGKKTDKTTPGSCNDARKIKSKLFPFRGQSGMRKPVTKRHMVSFPEEIRKVEKHFQ